MAGLYDGGPFLPGLKPRGHEDVLGLTAGELLAGLPRPASFKLAEARAEERRLDDEERFEATETDHEVVRAYLHRHGHRSER